MLISIKKQVVQNETCMHIKCEAKDCSMTHTRHGSLWVFLVIICTYNMAIRTITSNCHSDKVI